MYSSKDRIDIVTSLKKYNRTAHRRMPRRKI